MLERIRIVLIGTSHPGNIGGTARAMHNMGLTDLALVAPRCEPLTADTVSRPPAPTRWSTTPERSTTWKTRSATAPWWWAPALAHALSLADDHTARAGRALAGRTVLDARAGRLVFGREDSGLTNTELQRCHAHVHIPTNPDFSSLNLAAAVQVLAYECRLACLTETTDSAEPEAAPLATHEELEHYFAHLERCLIAIGFYDPAMPRQLMARLRRFTLRLARSAWSSTS